MDTMQGLSRTHYCGEPRIEHQNSEIVVSGFVQKIRDKGGLVFIDLRDRTGILQLVFDEGSPAGQLEKAQGVRSEFVLMAKGVLRERAAKNPELPTGGVELAVTDLRILSKAETPPFEITQGETNVREELRLRHRYLDLRRAEMQHAMIMRHKIVKATRDYFDRLGFIEVETPMLINSTPEGARDYLVPSRVHPGKFYALPQSPQLYKQLLMLSGFDRYMQIVKCFRDEDLRADRQPEFTQIDLEMSYVTEEDVMAVVEGFLTEVFGKVLGHTVNAPLRRLRYAEAMERFGSDKPDTRFGLELVNLTDCLKNTEFKVFAGAIEAGGSVRAINVKAAAETLTRKEIDKLVEVAKAYKAKGLAFTRLTAERESSSYEKFLSGDEKNAVRAAMGAENGDVLLIVADSDPNIVFDSLGALRVHLGEKLALYDPATFDLLWVTEFPLFEYDAEEGRFAAKHHPFTSPHPDDLESFTENPVTARARAYDIILNGCEIGGGSIRISNPELQSKMFEALRIDEKTANERFGYLLEAFKYGVPPHGGLAFGLDRLVMLMLGKSSIRDVIAFPKVQNASDLMTSAPTAVDGKSLAELHIKVAEE